MIGCSQLIVLIGCCRKPYNLQLEAMLFGSYSCLGEQEVTLRLYLCDALFKVQDFREVSTRLYLCDALFKMLCQCCPQEL